MPIIQKGLALGMGFGAPHQILIPHRFLINEASKQWTLDINLGLVTRPITITAFYISHCPNGDR